MIIPQSFDAFSKIYFCDFEFTEVNGEKPIVICAVAKELRSNKTIRLLHEGASEFLHKFPVLGPNELFVAYSASAEMKCIEILGIKMPENVLDLFAEFRKLTNGSLSPKESGLLSALRFFGHETMENAEKERMRSLAIRGGPFTEEEKSALIEYCETDVLELEKLFLSMKDNIDLPRALLRGEYMKAIAKVELNGIPIDEDKLSEFNSKWDDLKLRLVETMGKDYPVFDGISFNQNRFENFLENHAIPWPRLETGRLDLKDDTFKEMSVRYPMIGALRELRKILSNLKLHELPVSKSDNRNRTSLKPFMSITGRNQPSTNKFIFGLPKWLRGLIKPPIGKALAYIDYCQQEFGIAAKLSGDENMMEAYRSGDPYLALAVQSGAVPKDATKKTHPEKRALFKECVLAVQYCMGQKSLAERIELSLAHAKEILDLHKRTYCNFWEFTRNHLDNASLEGRAVTTFGWVMHYRTGETKLATLQNFPMQANGAEMLRLAIILLNEAGIKVCAPVHDAVLIESDIDTIELDVTKAQGLMAKASRVVLDGFELRTDVEIVRYPERFMDERGLEMWTRINDELSQITARG